MAKCSCSRGRRSVISRWANEEWRIASGGDASLFAIHPPARIVVPPRGTPMLDKTTAAAEPEQAAPQQKPRAGTKANNPRYAALYRRYPTIDYLRRAARRRLPHFA